MALIHQQLYRSSDLSKISFDEYLHQLVSQLIRAYVTDPDKITIDIEAKDIYMGIDLAIPCGLIINELISNSLKHAFSSNTKGKIEVIVNKDNDMYYLIVRDNGTGFPDNLDFRNTQTLGMQLVITLAEQLQGKIELNRSSDTTEFIITFPFE